MYVLYIFYLCQALLSGLGIENWGTLQFTLSLNFSPMPGRHEVPQLWFLGET